MEYIRREMEVCQDKSNVRAQITVDDDYIVKDTKPDVIQVVHGKGCILLEETKANKDAVWILGKLRFQVLYITDREYSKLETLEGEIPFQEKLNMNGVDEQDQVKVEPLLEDLNIGIINSRKLAVRALVEMHATAMEQNEESIITDIEGENLQKRWKEKEILTPVENVWDKNTYRLVIDLPSSKPNIAKILCSQVRLCILDSQMKASEEGILTIAGVLTIGLIYESVSGEEVEWYETNENIEHTISLQNAQTDDLLWVNTKMECYDVTMLEDYDGENRQVEINYTLNTMGEVYKEEKIRYLDDVYSMKENLQVIYAPQLYRQLLVKNVAKIRLREQENLGRDLPRMLQIVTSTGNVEIDQVTARENGVYVEGVLKVELLYVTNSDSKPISKVKKQIEFEQMVEVKNMSPETKYKLEPCLDQLQVNLMDNSNYEISAFVLLGVLAYDEKQMNFIQEVKELPSEEEKRSNRPGMIGYVARENEQLWDIAKRFRTCVEDLKKINEIEKEDLEYGQKILIVNDINKC